MSPCGTQRDLSVSRLRLEIDVWLVKGGKVQTEQMFSGLHLKADARRSREKNRKHPAMERVKGTFS